jgi:hypothetical protein
MRFFCHRIRKNHAQEKTPIDLMKQGLGKEEGGTP